MDWYGVRDDTKATDTQGAAEALNISFSIDGELRRRIGLANRITHDGMLSTEHTHPTAGNFLISYNSVGSLKSVNLATNVINTLKTGLDTVYRGTFTRSNGRVYYTNDFNKMQSIDRGDDSAYDVGIDAPVGAIGAPTATAGDVIAGLHLIRYRYYNSKTGYISNPSDALEYTVASTAETLTFSISAPAGGGDIIRSVDPKVDQIIIEMTPTGGAEYYWALKLNQTATSAAVSMDDGILQLQNSAAQFGDFGHEPPPLCSIVTEHRGRLFGTGATVRTLAATVVDTSATVTGTGFSLLWAGRLITFGSEIKAYRVLSVESDTSLTLSEPYSGALGVTTATVFSRSPDEVYWSRAGFPESWKAAEWGRRVFQNQADTPSGVLSAYGDLYLFGQRSMRRLVYTDDPALGMVVPVLTEMGLWNQQCLVSADGNIYGWGRSGAWVIRGTIPRKISKPIDLSLTDIDKSLYSQFFGFYDPLDRVIMWLYTAVGDTAPRKGFFLDLDSGKMGTVSFRHGLQCATLAAQGDQVVKVMICDNNGYTWEAIADTFDGVPSTMDGGILTMAPGSTTTVLAIASPSLPTGASNIIGAIAYDPVSLEERVVTANTADTITVGTAFTTAPVDGAVLYVGSFPVAYKTKHAQTQAGAHKIRPSYVSLSMVPSDSKQKINVKTYANFETTPMPYTSGAYDINPDGVLIIDGSSHAVVDGDGGSGDGFVSIPVPGSWRRTVAIRLDTETPYGDLRLLDVSLAEVESVEVNGE